MERSIASEVRARRVLPPLGTSVVYRSVCCADAPALGAFYRTLSPGSRQLRFHGMGALSGPDLACFASADGHRAAGWVALTGGVIVGHAMLVPTAEAGTMEIGVAVADAFQNRRIGTQLCVLAGAWACRHGVRRILAPVLWGNTPMEHLAHSLGQVRCSTSAGVENLSVELRPRAHKPGGPSRQA
jgi:GNAT superfamily N-acetyltransferase